MTHNLHASCVAFGKRAVLITGHSGSGKSALALELISIGAVLIADDQTLIETSNDQIVAKCPESIQGVIEARGIGLLRCHTQDTGVVRLVVDMDKPEPTRLPPHRVITLLGLEVDLVFGKDTANLAVAVKLLLHGGRIA